jgi:hypothetical protein
VLGLAWTFCLNQAAAQEIEQVGPASARSYGGSPVAKMSESAILPPNRLELGGELVFITADRAPPALVDSDGTPADKNPIDFSDVALLPLHARFAPADWIEVSAGAELLVKQSEAMSEPVWQNADAAVRIPFGSVFAGSVHGAYGLLTEDQGAWWQVESSLLAKPSSLDWLRFELRLGHAVTGLSFTDASAPVWLEELMTHAEIQFGEEEGGFWIGVDYYVPVAHESPGGAAPEIDPNVRLNLELGCVLSPQKTGWDFYVGYAVVDRGNVEHPETTLPILNGGFDQRQWLLGVQHHFDLGDREAPLRLGI